MKNHSIFYVVHGQFFKNSYENKKNLKKVEKPFKIFENEKPKELRKKALSFFEKIRDENLIKNDANCVALSYCYGNDTKKPINEIQSVSFFRQDDDEFFENENLEIALTVSFGKKYENEIIQPFNTLKGKLYPIAVVGKALPKIEEWLKINLVREKHSYEELGLAMCKDTTINNFIDKELLKSYLIEISSEVEDYYFFKNELTKHQHSFFKTPQFYQITEKDISIKKQDIKTSFLELFEQKQNVQTAIKLAVYKKELRNLSKFLFAKRGLEVDFTKAERNKISDFLNNLNLKPFYSSQQLSVFDEMIDQSYLAKKLLRELL